MLRRLAVVTRAWTTGRLLWLWFFAYACVVTSGFLRPISPNDTYFECPRFLLPADAVNPATDLSFPRNQPSALRNIRALIVRDGNGSYAYRLPATGPWDNVSVVNRSLGQLPALDSLYVGDYNGPEAFRRLCAQFPGIHVWHLDLNGGRLASTFFLLLATLTLGGAVLQQTQALLSLPLARTVPGFLGPHLVVPLAITVAGIALTSYVARSFGADFWATIAVQVFAWGVWSAFEFRIVSLPKSPWRRRHSDRSDGNSSVTAERASSWGGALLLLGIAICLVIFIAHPYVLESYLRGELPWLDAGFLVMGVALAGAAVMLLPTFCVAMNETGVTAILSLQDLEKRRGAHGVLPVRFERRVDRLRRPARWPEWLWRIRAIHAGNPDVLMPVVVRIVGPIVVVVALNSYAQSHLFSTIFAGLLLAAGWLISLSYIFSNWWQRRKTFCVQLLYPWTRGQLIRSVFAAYVFDSLGILLVLFATLRFCELSLAWHLPMPLIGHSVLGIALAAALFITGGLWLLTLRHRMLASFLALGGVLFLCAAMTAAGRLILEHESEWRIALPFAFVSCVLAFDAWRRWMKNEWGLFGT